MMNAFSITKSIVFCFLICTFCVDIAHGQKKEKFRAIAFYTGENDEAHVSFVKEASKWLLVVAKKYNFGYELTSDWSRLNTENLAKFQVVIFLDTRPEKPEQRSAFENYMKNGGAWMGFHFSAFALTPSSFPQNWDWYHNEFLGSGQYASNTWRPTSAVLKVNHNHPITRKLPNTFKSQPNEWYRWEKDLRKNPDINILLTIDSTSFPLGTGPKKHEIWTSGYYPVVWTNKNYKMVYINMGHNDMDYEHKLSNFTTTQSFTFANEIQNKLVINALLWLGDQRKNGTINGKDNRNN